MSKISEWVEKIQNDKPEYSDLLDQIKNNFTENGFNLSAMESLTDKKLSDIEDEIRKELGS